MRIVAISDTHMTKPHIPEGDVLVHAGDLTCTGSIAEVRRALDWILDQPHKHKFVIPGNHDFALQESPSLFPTYFMYIDKGVEIEGIKFWGTPWVNRFMDWAFMLDDTNEGLGRKYEGIPEDTQILVSHGPAYGILDETFQGEKVGSKALLDRIHKHDHNLPQLAYHIFGHIHDSYGNEMINRAMHRDSYVAMNVACKPQILDI